MKEITTEQLVKLLDEALSEAPSTGNQDQRLRDKLTKDAEQKNLVPVGATNWAYKWDTTGETDEKGRYKLSPGKFASFKTVDGRFVPIQKNTPSEKPSGPSQQPTAISKTSKSSKPKTSVKAPSGGKFSLAGASKISSRITSHVEHFRESGKINQSVANKFLSMANIIDRASSNLMSNRQRKVDAGRNMLAGLVDRFQLRPDIIDGKKVAISVGRYNKIPTQLKTVLNSSTFNNMLDYASVKPLAPVDSKNNLRWKSAVAFAATPTLKTKHSVETSDEVKEIFDKFETLSGLRESSKELYCVVDENGKFKPSGGSNSREYLAKSIEEDESLDNVIDVLETHMEDLSRYESIGLKPTVGSTISDMVPIAISTLKNYKENLRNLTTKMPDMSMSEVADYVNKTYAEMVVELHSTDATLAGTILKGFAETHMYRQELARGDQAYLPPDNTFPGVDKIRIEKDGDTAGERLSLVQVKYGLSKDDTFGFKTEARTLAYFANDEKYRTIFSHEAGAEGSETGIDSQFITDSEEFSSLLEDADLLDAVTDVDELQAVTSKFITETTLLREQLRGKLRNQKALSSHLSGKLVNGPKMQKQRDELAAGIWNTVDENKILKKFGPAITKKVKDNPLLFINTVALSAVLKTSNGLDKIVNNAQFIKDDSFISKEYIASPSVRNWNIEWSTAGRSSGTLRVGPRIPSKK